MGDQTKPPAQRLHAALALADYGQVDAAAIADGVTVAADGQCRQILKALANSSDAAIKALDQRFAATDPKEGAVARARLAIVALYLGDSKRAIELSALAADPTPKRVFEETLAVWHGDWGELIQAVERAGNGSLRASVALGIGRASSQGLAEPEQRAVVDTLTRWFKDAPDTGTHGATDWALRQWSVELPRLETTESLSKGRDWYVNSLGRTMLKIPSGKFRMGDGRDIVDVELTRAFYLADREVSVEEFQEFMADSETPAIDRPEKWEGVNEHASPTAAHPVQQVNWFDAVLFCNWLSRREKRAVCYTRDESTKGGWKLVQEAKGYRLPTEAEWEYGCRSGTTTTYCFGDDAELVKGYGVVHASLAAVCGSKLPNSHGLFDLHGNIWEWCHDKFDLKPPGGTNPIVDVGSGEVYRVLRGGCWIDFVTFAPSSKRFRTLPAERYRSIGFRTSRTE